MADFEDFSTPSLALCLFIMMCALASGLDLEIFKKRLKKPKGIIIGLVCQFGFLPLIAFALANAFNFDYETSTSLVLTATCPGGVLSNFFAFAIGADLPLSIAMTTASSLLSFAFIPLNIFLYITLGLDSDGIEIDWVGLIGAIAILVIALLIGM